MVKKTRWSFVAVVLAACAHAPAAEGGAPLPAAQAVTEPAAADDDLLPKPLADDPLGVTVHALSNGMRVYISPDHTKPLVDARIIVRAGHRHESDDATGLAHYLEHMLFKGTDKLGTRDYEAERPHLERIAALYDDLAAAEGEAARTAIFAEIDAETQAAAKFASPNEVSSVLSTIGAGNVNAATAKDTTRYTVDNLPVNRLETWATLEAERFRSPVFRLFLPELESVYEEKNRALDNAFRLSHKAGHAMAFGDHPYARPSLGTAEHLRTPAYGEMVRFYDKWYVPGNMAVVLVGDIEPETVLPLLERTLGALPARDVPEQPHQVPKPSKDKTRVVYGDNASVSLVWPTVAMSHADVPAIAVMNQIFSDGDNGLLEAELIRTHEIAGGGSGGSEYREGGVWTTGAAVRPDQEHATVSASLQRVVKRLLAGDFSEEAVAAVKLQFELQDMWRLESRSSRSYEIQQSIVAGGTWRDRLAQRKRYAKVTKEDVVRVANKYLSGEPHVVRLERGDPEVPKLKSPKITPLKLDTGSKSPFAQSLVDQKVEPLSPAFASAETDFFAQELPGGRFVAVPNEVNELVTVMYSFDIGGRDDPLLCPSLDAMEIGGTSGRTASELQDEFGRLGAQPWIYCGTESSGIGFLTFDRNLAATTALLHEWARDLVVDDEAVRAMTHSVIEERKDHYTNARALAAALSSWALLGDESPYRQRASNAELGTLTGAAAAKRTRELLRRPHRTMYYGGRTIEDAAAILALPKPDLPIPEHAPRKYRHRKKPTVFLIDKKLAKSDVRVLVPMPSLYDSRDPESYLFDEYYDGGMDSLLFQEIREARALAYSVWASTENPDWPGDELALRMGVQTAADKTTLAAAALLEVLARPIDAKRYQRVKRGELQSMRRWRWEPRSLAGRVETWEQLGLKGDPRRDRWDRIQTVEAADLEAFRTKVTADAPVITIVGDREAMDEKTLAKMGKVVTVEPKSLFSYE